MSTKKETEFALLVHTCDRYQFLYPGFSAFFNKYWDFAVPCNYYFATENLNVNIDGFENIRSGSGQWSDRLAKLIREQVKEKYIIYFQEDMWLNKPVDPKFFEALFKLIEANDWKQVKLTSASVYKTEPTKFTVEGFTVAQLDNEKSGYLMSHQVTVWERDYLLAQLHKNEHPWRNERKGTKRLKKLNPQIFQIDYFEENGEPEINNNPNTALRSGYKTVSENSTLNLRVLSYIAGLKQDSKFVDYANKLQQHYNQQLTHDGKPKPRKIDLVKRIKNWLKR